MSYQTVPLELLVEEYLKHNPPATYEEYVGFKIQSPGSHNCSVEIHYKIKDRSQKQ